MKRFALSLFFAVGVLALVVQSPAAWAAERRVALIIGNSAYQNVSALANPASDARAMAEKFKDAGFEVVSAHHDLGNLQFKRALRQFEDAATDADIAVVFYAGHGIEIRGTNYMIPVDARLASDRDAEDEAITLDRLLQSVEGAKRLGLVILDACRDNPFMRTMKRTRAAALRAVTTGLTIVEPTGHNTLIAYAARAGNVAEDGLGANSPFTTALLKHLFVPGLDIRLAFGRVRDDVLRGTSQRQEPFVSGSLGGAHISIVTQPTQATPVATASDAAGQRNDYALVEKIGTQRAWEIFLTQHSTGFYADLARQQLAKLGAGEPANAPARKGPEGTTVAALEPNRSAPPPGPSSEEQRAWDRIKDSSNVPALRDFVRRYPSSVLANAAQLRLEALERAVQEREEKARLEREAKAAEAARSKAEQEAAARRADEERLAKLAEEARRKQEAAAEAVRQKAEREAALKRAEEERQAKVAEAARARQEAAAEAARQKAEREAALKREEEEKRARAAEAAAREKADREAAQRRAEEERHAKAAEAERLRQQTAAEAARQKAEREAALKRTEEEKQAKLAEAARAREAAAAAEAARQQAAREAEQRRAEGERQAKATETARLKAEEVERQRIQREAAAKKAEEERLANLAEDARRKQEAATEAERQHIQREAALKRAEDERQAKAAEAERAKEQATAEAERQKVQREAALKRTEDERLAKLAESARVKQDAACKREEGLIASAQSGANRSKAREDLNRLEYDLTCERLRPTLLAALDKLTAEPEPPKETPKPQPGSAELIRAAQAELARLGCFSGKADGNLNIATRDALKRYQAQRGQPRAETEVTDELVTALKDQDTRICPLVCPAGKVAQGEQCIATHQKAAPVAKQGKEEEPKRQQKARQEESKPQPRVRQEAASSPSSRHSSGGGGGRSGGGAMIGVGF